MLSSFGCSNLAAQTQPELHRADQEKQEHSHIEKCRLKPAGGGNLEDPPLQAAPAPQADEEHHPGDGRCHEGEHVEAQGQERQNKTTGGELSPPPRPGS